MNRKTLAAAALVAGSALVSASYLLRPRARLAAPRSDVLAIITPVIDLRCAEAVLAQMQRLPRARCVVVLHTLGGCVTSCVMIANALQHFESSIAVVPYMAISGGTMIALSAHQLHMGKSASLSAVDPLIDGQRVRHLPAGAPAHGLHGAALEYEAAIRRHLRATLAARLGAAHTAAIDRAMAVFMGEHAPHEWPIGRSEVAALGLPVRAAAPTWAAMVDQHRGGW